MSTDIFANRSTTMPPRTRNGERLARRLLQRLGTPPLGSGSPTKVHSLDLVEDALDDFSDTRVRRLTKITADIAAAAAMLARGLVANPGLMEMLRGSGPLVVIDVPNPDWIEPIDIIFRSAILAGARPVRNGDVDSLIRHSSSPEPAVLFARDGASSSHRPDRGNAAVGDAVQAGAPVVGIGVSAARTLPRDLMRAATTRIEIGPLDPAAIAFVVEAVTGHAPKRLIEPGLASICAVTDLRLAVTAVLDAEASLVRLETLLRASRVGVITAGPRLEDMHGLDEAREWGLALVDDLRCWVSGRGGISFGDCESSVLLSGPPGCGKTRFAMALARSAGLPLLAGSLGQWQSSREGHLGHTLAAMRSFFEKARREPCVVLIDEIDSFGDRTDFPDHHRNYSTQVVNALLECLDGPESRDGIVVVGTTNFPERVDPAILRAGRLERHIRIGSPDLAALGGIIRQYFGATVPEDDIPRIAAAARGLTGADVETAARHARAMARRTGRNIGADDAMAAITAGHAPLNDATRLRASIHEAGHGLAALASGTTAKLSLSIGPTGGFAELGLPAMPGSGTERDFDDLLVLLLAGRAAEETVLGDVSAGAVADLAQATRIASQMEAIWGFSNEFPLLSVGSAAGIDLTRMPWLVKPVHARLERAYDRACRALSEERVILVRLGEALFRSGYLEDREIRSLAGGHAPPTEVERSASRRRRSRGPAS